MKDGVFTWKSPLGWIEFQIKQSVLIRLNFIDRASYTDILHPVSKQLDDYFNHRRRDFDLPIRLTVTPFSKQVLDLISEIPYGRTATYNELACQIERNGLSRAVGRATGRNPILIIIPCHRVVGIDGSLRGYAGGLGKKRELLNLEKGINQTQLFS